MARRHAVALALAAVVAGAVIVRGNVNPTPVWEWITDAPVHAATPVHTVAYLGGAFRFLGRVTPEAPSFVDVTTGTLSVGCATRTGPVDGDRPIVVPDPAGGLFMQVPASPERLVDGAGEFVVPASRSFVRIGDDCRFDRGFQLDTFVPGDLLSRGGTIARAGEVVYVAGSRPVGFGDRQGYVAAFNPSTGARVGAWDFPAYDRVIIEGATPGGQLVATVPSRAFPAGPAPVGVLTPASGAFLSLGTVTSAGFVKVTGTALYVSPAPGQPLQAFDLASGAPRPGWSAPSLTVTDIDVADGRVFVAGAGLGLSGVLALDEITGTLITSFAPLLRALDGTPADVQRLAVIGSRLFLRGRGVRRLDGSDRYLLAAVSTVTGEGDAWAPLVFAPTADGIDLVPNGGHLYVGRVASDTLVRRTHLAAIDLSTGEILSFDPGGTPENPFVPPVTALAATADHLYVGSSQGQIRRVLRGSGQTDGWSVTTTTGGGGPAVVATLTAAGPTLYAGGFFTTAFTSSQPSPVARSHALAVDMAGATLTSWAPSVTSADGGAAEGRRPVAALLRVGNVVVLGGRFTAVAGDDRVGLAAVDAATGTAITPAFTLPEGHVVTGLANDGEVVYYVGSDESGGTGAAPIIGAATIPTGVSPWVVPGGRSPSSRVTVLEGLVYSGPEWDPVDAAPTTTALVWRHPVAVADRLLEIRDLPDGEQGPVRVRAFTYVTGGSPRAPRNLTVQYADHDVHLSWRPPRVGEVLSYVIHAGPASGQSGLAVVDTGSTETSFSATAPEAVYYVRVHARTATGLSPASNEVAFALAPNVCNLPPREPGTLTAEGFADRVSLGWGAAIGATSYVVEAGSQPGASDRAAQNVGRRLTLLTAAPPGLYFVRIVGVNACGRGPASNEVAVQVGDPAPGPPANLQVTVAGAVATLTWDPPADGGPVTYYRLEAGSAPGLANIAVTTTTGTAFLAPPAAPGTYYVRVRAGSPSGLSAPTPDVAVAIGVAGGR